MSRFDLSQIQSQAILDMQLRRLTALDHLRLEEEHAELTKQIAELEASSPIRPSSAPRSSARTRT